MNDTKVSLNQALEAIKAGEFAAAEVLCRSAIDHDPKNTRAWHLCGIACAQRDLIEEAATCFENCIELNSSVANYHYNLGLAYRRLKRFDEAADCYRLAIEINPELIEAHNNLATLLVEQGASGEARDTYQRVLEKFPDSSIAHYNLGSLLEDENRPEEAIEHYQLAVESDASFSCAHHALVEALIHQERNEEAGEALKRWLKSEPDNELADHLRPVITGEAPSDRCGDDFVRATFDKEFATTYESQLAKIGYRGPDLVQDELSRLNRELENLDVLDAGCGTGLCGPILRPTARKLDGVDLAPEMLEQARTKNLYDQLIESELTSYLQTHASTYDLIVAADTLCYFGNLQEVVCAARESLKPDGVFLFTVERQVENDAAEGSFELQGNGRYRHSESYVQQVVSDEGFELAGSSQNVIRSQRGKAVQSLAITAIRRT